MARILPPRVAITRESDQLKWHEFDKLARRLKYSISGALREAAFEWVSRHRDDPAPESVVKNDMRRRQGVDDPFPK